MNIVAVATDLMSQSRISAASRATGHTVRFVVTDGDLVTAMPAYLALVDLDAETEIETMIRLLKERGLLVVAFGPHLDTERRKAARAAGADRVLAKSKFVTELPRLMEAAGHHD
jgi:hypothetical protein